MFNGQIKFQPPHTSQILKWHYHLKYGQFYSFYPLFSSTFRLFANPPQPPRHFPFLRVFSNQIWVIFIRIMLILLALYPFSQSPIASSKTPRHFPFLSGVPSQIGVFLVTFISNSADFMTFSNPCRGLKHFATLSTPPTGPIFRTLSTFGKLTTHFLTTFCFAKRFQKVCVKVRVVTP
jgi:hypothetical protein